MRFGSVCSGIEAASVAWNPLDWEAAWFSEIEPFPCQVLKHHYPTVPNHGDMTKFKDWPDEPIDLLCGGTPCQSFSVAGLRKGLDDPRGNLMLTFGAIAARYRPTWLVWENVPGVLSSNGGRDFGTFLGMLGQLGYGFAYRILDAQHFGVPQRRRRVFVVGCLGDWRRAAAVLFERHSLSGDIAPSRKAGEGTAASLRGRTKGGDWPSEIAGTLDSFYAKKMGLEDQHLYSQKGSRFVRHRLRNDDPVAIQGNLIGRDEGGPQGVGASDEGVMYTLTKADVHGVAQPIPFDTTQITSAGNYSSPKSGDPCHPLAAGAHAPAVAFNISGSSKRDFNVCKTKVSACLSTKSQEPSEITQNSITSIVGNMQVRRLTPTECERLQGFPDGYTAIPWRNKLANECPDGPRYKALGNSWAVPVVRWIGERINAVNKETK